MSRSKTSEIIDSMLRQRLDQGFNVRMSKIDYDTLMLDELTRIENFSTNYSDELKCLSHCIRQYLWKNNTEYLYKIISILNIVIDRLVDILGSEKYWSLDSIIEYVNHLYCNRKRIGITDDVVYKKIIDYIQTEHVRKSIEKSWNNILLSDNGSNTFLETFDDIFENAIEKYQSEFIHSLNETDVLYRMVTERICNTDRFIPWPNKAQNRWNPPGKTYLYLSYQTNDTDYNNDLKFGQYICLLECKLKTETDVCFCRFKPLNSGRILDLSYNDIELYSIQQNLGEQYDKHLQFIIKILLKDKSAIQFRRNKNYLKKKIKETINAHPIDKSFVEKNLTRQILKLICSCIYKKIDEDDECAKEKAYKSFQILAEYLETKGITGIIYPCTRTRQIPGKNIVLFNINDAEPVDGSIIQYHYNGISR